MFQDAKEELERLNRQLLEEDDEEEYDEEDEYEEDEEEYEEDEAQEDEDTTPEDLEQEPQRSGWGLVSAILLLTAGVILLLAFLLARRGGIL